MHKSVKLGLAAMSLGAAAAAIGATPASAEDCVICEPAPGADPFGKHGPAQAATLLKFTELLSKFDGTDTFGKLLVVFDKVGESFNKFVAPPTVG